MIIRGIALITTVALIAPGALSALDVPISARKVVVKTEPASAKRRFLLKTVGDPGILLLGTPTVNGATLFAAGLSCIGSECTIAGSTESLHLPASFWQGLGDPPGSRGFLYKDPNGTAGGVRVVVIKPERLTIKAVGEGWTWLPAGGEDAVVVTLSLRTAFFGPRRYCVEMAGSEGINQPGHLSLRNAAAPSACRALCGNGNVDDGEECEGLWLEESWVRCDSCKGCTLEGAPGCEYYDCCDPGALCLPPPGGGPGYWSCALPGKLGEGCYVLAYPEFSELPCEGDLFCEPVNLFPPYGYQGICCSLGKCSADSDCCSDGVCETGQCCGTNGSPCGGFTHGGIDRCCAGQVCCDGTNCPELVPGNFFDGTCCGDVGSPCSDGSQCCSGSCDTIGGTCQ